MVALQFYAQLIATVNGSLLEEQTGITVQTTVNGPARVTIFSAVPEQGLEFDAHRRLGETVNVSVHVYLATRDKGPELFSIRGRIISAEMAGKPHHESTHSFTVEQEKPTHE